jgi:hypothetical protein
MSEPDESSPQYINFQFNVIFPSTTRSVKLDFYFALLILSLIPGTNPVPSVLSPMMSMKCQVLIISYIQLVLISSTFIQIIFLFERPHSSFLC